MTAGEIIDLYTHAKNPKKQIGIIAELCDCSKEDIVKILKNHGVELPEVASNQNEDTYIPQPETIKWQSQENLIIRLYLILDKLDEEIRQKTEKYKEVSTAIKVLSELQEGEKNG